MSKDTILKQNEDGEIIEVPLKDFFKAFQAEHEVPDFEHEQAPMKALQVVDSLYQLASAGDELPDTVSEYSKYYDLMKEAVTESKKLATSKKDAETKAKEDEKAAKEAAKKAEEEKAKALEQRQNLFLVNASKGAEAAASEFADDLKSMRDSLPKGITIQVNDDQSFGLVIDENVSDEDLSNSLGYMVGSQENSEFMRGAYQFFIGAMANELVRRGVYSSMIKCGEALAKKLSESGFRTSGRNIEGYARMDKRIPIELRNPKADPSAYLEISNIPYGEKPKKEKDESKGDFEERQKEYVRQCDAIDKDRLKLAKMLKEGKMVGKDAEGNEVSIAVVSRKDILPIIKQTKIKHGLAKEEDPNKKSLSDWARQYVEAELLLENFLGVHEKGFVLAYPADDDGKLVRKYSKEDLNTIKEEALNNLRNMFFGDKLDELIKGKRVVQVAVMEEVDGKQKIKKDKDGNQVKEDKEEDVYPKLIAIGG